MALVFNDCLLTLNLSLWSFDVGQHAGHVDTVSVQVLQEDISIAPGQRTGLHVCREKTDVTYIHWSVLKISFKKSR